MARAGIPNGVSEHRGLGRESRIRAWAALAENLRALDNHLLRIRGFAVVYVASYPDLFVLKVVSGRPSDVRDLGALVWKNGVPKVEESLKSLNDEKFFWNNLKEKIIPEIGHGFFPNSWGGCSWGRSLGERSCAKSRPRLHNW